MGLALMICAAITRKSPPIYYCGPDNSVSCDPHLFSIPPTLQESSKVGDEHFGEVFIQNVFGDFAGT